MNHQITFLLITLYCEFVTDLKLGFYRLFVFCILPKHDIYIVRLYLHCIMIRMKYDMGNRTYGV